MKTVAEHGWEGAKALWQTVANTEQMSVVIELPDGFTEKYARIDPSVPPTAPPAP